MPTARSNDCDLYYEEHGRGAPLLLIPGLGCATWLWERNLGALAEHFRVIALTAPRQRFRAGSLLAPAEALMNSGGGLELNSGMTWWRVSRECVWANWWRRWQPRS